MAKKKKNSSTKSTKKFARGIPVKHFWAKVIGFMALVGTLVFINPIISGIGGVWHSIKQGVEHLFDGRVQAYGIRVPKAFSVHGIDVSRYQANINWMKVKNMEDDGVKIQFVFIKSTEGERSVDPYFKRNWHRAKQAGLIRGAYHYFKPKKPGKAQAAFFMQTVPHAAGDLPPAIDVEETGNLSAQKLRANLKECLLEVERRMGRKPIIYTGYRFYLDHLKGHFDGYPFWIAHYYEAELKVTDDTAWNFWQHSDIGQIDGVKHKVDFNVFNGTEGDLQRFLLGGE